AQKEAHPGYRGHHSSRAIHACEEEPGRGGHGPRSPGEREHALASRARHRSGLPVPHGRRERTIGPSRTRLPERPRGARPALTTIASTFRPGRKDSNEDVRGQEHPQRPVGRPRRSRQDHERASFEPTLDQLVKAFGTQVAPLQFPIGEEHNFSGLADLLSEKAYRYESGPSGTEGDWPEDIHAKADPFREKLTEAVAEADDALLEKYLEEGTLPETEVVKGIRAGFVEAKNAPVMIAPAAKPIAADRLVHFISDVFPSPLERPPVKVFGKDGKEQERASDVNQPPTALVFKT